MNVLVVMDQGSTDVFRATTVRALIWTLLSIGAFIGAFAAVIPPIGFVESSLQLDHRAGLAAWSVGWGALSVLGVVVAARVTLGAWLPVTGRAWLAAATGIALSALVVVALSQWQVGRFGYAEFDRVGPTAWLFGAVNGVGVASFAVHVAPPRVVGWPLVPAALAAAATLLIVASNVPGLHDGIGADSWALATVLGATVLHSVLALGSGVLSAARRSRRHA